MQIDLATRVLAMSLDAVRVQQSQVAAAQITGVPASPQASPDVILQLSAAAQQLKHAG